MNVQIYLNGADITAKTISYTATKKICTGTAELNISVEWITGVNITPWDTIVIYEEGIKIGTYFVSEAREGVKEGTIDVIASDASKKIMEYYIPTPYEYSYTTTTKFWIAKILEEATITDYELPSSSGSTVAENVQIGMVTAYEALVQMLQMSGWYMYFDANNKCIVGVLTKDLSNPELEIIDNDILEFSSNVSDRMMRNRAVVWGKTSPTSGTVYADVYRHTPWDTSSQDKRTVAYTNNMIPNSSTAKALAVKMLDEFAVLNHEKTFIVTGSRIIEVGNILQSRSEYFSGNGLVTTVSHKMSSSGLITEITIDERCPRIFGYFYFSDYVYIGTNTQGIWRKHLDDTIWEAFSNGLDEYEIKDLIIKGGLFACVAGTHLYINVGSNTPNWKKITPPILEDQEDIGFISGYTDAVACDIDTNTHAIYCGYKVNASSGKPADMERSWIVEYSPAGTYKGQYQLFRDTKDYMDFRILDVDKYGKDKTALAVAPVNHANGIGLFGSRMVFPYEYPDPRSKTLGMTPGAFNTDQMDALFFVDSRNNGPSHLMAEGDTVSAIDNTTFRYYGFDDDDNVYSLHKDFDWPMSYFGWRLSIPRNVCLYRMIYRDSSYKKVGNSTEEVQDSDRLYHIVEVNLDTAGFYFYHFTFTPTLDCLPTQADDVKAVATSNVYRVGNQTVDGVALITGDRVLLVGQDNPTENGIYMVMGGSPWTRVYDAPLIRGLFVNVAGGVGYNGTSWQLDIPGQAIVGLDDINFVRVLDISSSSSGINYFDTSELDYGSVDLISVYMVNGAVFAQYSGRKTEGSQVFSIRRIAVNNFGGTNCVEYLRVEQTRRTGLITETPLYPSEDGAGTTYVIGSYVPISAISEAILQTVSFNPVGGVTSNPPSTIARADPGPYGDWKSIPHPNYDSTIDSVKLYILGYKITGKNVTTYIRYKAQATAGSQMMCCYLTCWGCLARELKGEGVVLNTIGNVNSRGEVVDSDENQYITIIITGPDGCCIEDHNGTSPAAGEIVDFGSLQIRNFSSRNSAVYGYGDTVRDCVTNAKIEDLTFSPFVPATHLDDLTGAIYLSNGLTGTVHSDIDSTKYGTGFFSGSSPLLFANGLFIQTSPIGYIINKLRKDYILYGQKLCMLLKAKDTGFKVMDVDFYEMKSEENKNQPLLAMTTGVWLISYTISGINQHGVFPEHLKIYDNGYSEDLVEGQFEDARTLDFYSTRFPTNTGYIDTLEGKQIVTPIRDVGNYVLTAMEDTTVYGLIESFAGNAGRTETSNYYAYTPYLFVNTSGVGGNKFYQKNPSATLFAAQQDAPSVVTVIRLDDRI